MTMNNRISFVFLVGFFFRFISLSFWIFFAVKISNRYKWRFEWPNRSIDYVRVDESRIFAEQKMKMRICCQRVINAESFPHSSWCLCVLWTERKLMAPIGAHRWCAAARCEWQYAPNCDSLLGSARLQCGWHRRNSNIKTAGSITYDCKSIDTKCTHFLIVVLVYLIFLHRIDSAEPLTRATASVATAAASVIYICFDFDKESLTFFPFTWRIYFFLSVDFLLWTRVESRVSSTCNALMGSILESRRCHEVAHEAISITVSEYRNSNKINFVCVDQATGGIRKSSSSTHIYKSIKSQMQHECISHSQLWCRGRSPATIFSDFTKLKNEITHGGSPILPSIFIDVIDCLCDSLLLFYLCEIFVNVNVSMGKYSYNNHDVCRWWVFSLAVFMCSVIEPL